MNSSRPHATPLSATRKKALSAAAFILCAMVLAPASSAHAGEVFNVAKFAVEASSIDAVAAKSHAMENGEQDAFNMLLRRLVPVQRYPNLPKIDPADITNMIEGMAVRSEQNSTTQYLATLDFTFSPDAVRDVLQAHRLPFVEVQAPQLLVVPLFLKSDGSLDRGLSPWRKAWLALDLANTLTPVKLGQIKADVTQQLVQSIISGDEESLNIVGQIYGERTLLLAIAEQSKDGTDILVHIAGADTVGPLSLQRRYRTFDDPERAMKQGAAISLAVLEGRWKATKVKAGPSTVADGAPQRVLLTVEFSGFREWQKIRQRLAKVPGISSMDVSSLSARGAEVTFDYPGGAAGLTPALSDQELSLENVNGAWILRSY